MSPPAGPIACCSLVLRSGWPAPSGAYTARSSTSRGPELYLPPASRCIETFLKLFLPHDDEPGLVQPKASGCGYNPRAPEPTRWLPLLTRKCRLLSPLYSRPSFPTRWTVFWSRSCSRR